MKGSGSTRFTELVKAAGQPHVVTLWTRPEEDGEFMKAVRGHRVLTVRQEIAGTRKDHGEVGFTTDAQSSNLYLVFPKSIQDFEGKRVVGIKYDLLAEEKPRGPVATPRPKQREGSPRGKQKPISKERPVVAKLEPTVAKATAGRARRKEKEQGQERQQPAPKPEPRFAVEVQRTATATTTLEVTAKTGALAKKMALERAGEAPVDVSRAVVRTRILSVRKMKTNN